MPRERGEIKVGNLTVDIKWSHRNSVVSSL